MDSVRFTLTFAKSTFSPLSCNVVVFFFKQDMNTHEAAPFFFLSLDTASPLSVINFQDNCMALKQKAEIEDIPFAVLEETI